eukprot:Nk52_evm142s226 gene=Nk52_evmTU142s226
MADVEARLAALEEKLESSQSDVDQFFLIVMGIFVFFMQAGFAMLEAGSCRSKNVTNILCKNFLDPCMGAVAFWAVGYSFLSGKGRFIGSDNFFMEDFPSNEYSTWFFQYVFAATATTIVSGAMAERTHFCAYLLYSVFISGFVYPVVAHWAWASDEGWLAVRGYMDFAGSSIVHGTGGAAALMGAIIVGPRKGRFDSAGNALPIHGHSTVLSCLGGLLLWAGFYAFNGGSELGIFGGSASQVGLVVVNTTLASAGGALVTISGMWMRFSRWSLLGAINGSLAGMVAICSGCNAVEPWAGFVIGAIAGAVYMVWSWVLLRFKIDDVIDASPVHLGAGIWGTIATPIFAHNTLTDTSGIFYSWDKESFKQFGYNLGGCVTIIAWSATLCGLFFLLLKQVGLLRISEDLEIAGLDSEEHGEPAYNDEHRNVHKPERDEECNIDIEVHSTHGSA